MNDGISNGGGTIINDCSSISRKAREATVRIRSVPLINCGATLQCGRLTATRRRSRRRVKARSISGVPLPRISSKTWGRLK
ncbi:hypothetical protein D3C84_1191290 [compost metagenome]